MSTERDRRQARKREKQRKKREEARRTRGSRKPPGAEGGRDVSEALDWPVGEAWMSEDWHEQGAHVHAIFTRQHADGRLAIAAIEADLADRGLVSVKAASGVSDPVLRAELVQRSSDTQAMVEVEPALVVKLARTAEAWGRDRGHVTPASWEAALALFGDVCPGDAPQEIRCGSPEMDTPTKPAQEGFFATLKRRLGLGGAPG